MKKILLSVCLTALTLNTTAQTQVAPYRPGVTVDGATYYLPRTTLRFVVTAEKSVYTPGDFCRYADRYLRLQVSDEPQTTWQLKTIAIAPYGTPDPQKIYTVRLTKRTVAPFVELSPDGILLAINTEGEMEELPPVPQGTTVPTRRNPRDFMTQEMLVAGSTAKMADLVAQEIFTIRDSRNALVRGEADNTPKDGTQLKLMLAQLDEQEEALTRLFKGHTDTTTEVFTFELTPEADVEKEILFRFSRHLGMVDKDDMAGAPFYISIRDLKTVPEPVYDEKASKKKQKMETGIYYNVPSRAAVEIFDDKRNYYKGEFHMGQFGRVEILSNVLFDKKNTTSATFYSETGGLKKLKAEEPQ